MRIIAGKYRGKVLFSPQTTKVRPTADMVKQALFTKLQFFVQDKSFLCSIKKSRTKDASAKKRIPDMVAIILLGIIGFFIL